MRDENNAKPLAPQTADNAIQLLSLRLPQRRRRLVHDEDAVLCFQCPHDLKQSLAGNGKRSRARIGIERYAETIGQFAESLDCGAVVRKGPQVFCLPRKTLAAAVSSGRIARSW